MPTQHITLNPETTPFNLDHTLQCGQVFRWQKQGACWQGIVKDEALTIKQTGNMLEFTGADAVFIKRYFRLDDPLPRILVEIGRDDYIRRVIRAFHGLRLIRQDPWECLASYVLATYSNIPRIKRMINTLCTLFGEQKTFNHCTFHAFPEPHALATASQEALERCKLGFRTKRLQQTAKRIDEKSIRLEDLQKTTYETAKKQLMPLPGIGEKAADCVLLFSLEKLEAFPVDTWMKKSVLKHYSAHFDGSFRKKVLKKESLSSGEYRQIGEFAREYFGGCAGYAQQYLFHYERAVCRVV